MYVEDNIDGVPVGESCIDIYADIAVYLIQFYCHFVAALSSGRCHHTI